MLGLMFSSIGTVVQMGFIIGVGLLLDTFVVRTVTVPALAVLAGKANWWPSKRVRGKKKSPQRLAHRTDDSSVRHLTGRRIELVSVFTGSPKDEGDHEAEPPPLLETDAPTEPVPVRAQNTSQDPDTTSLRIPLPVDTKGHWLFDPQCTRDYWDHYLTNGRGAVQTNGRGRLVSSSHDVGALNGVAALAYRLSQAETLPASRSRRDRFWRPSKSQLLTISAAGLLTFAIVSASSDYSELAVHQTGLGDNQVTVNVSPTAGGRDTGTPTDPAPPATQPEVVAVEPVPGPPAPQPNAPLPADPVVAAAPPVAPAPPGAPVVAAPQPAAPRPNQPVLAAQKPLAPLIKDSLRFVPDPIASPLTPQRRGHDGSSGSGPVSAEPDSGSVGTDGSGTGGTGTDTSGTGGTGTTGGT
jgi:hypothetical protein